VKSETLEHAPDLAIDSLSKQNAQSRWRNLLDAFSTSAFPIENNSAQKFRRQIRGGGAIEHYFVFLFDLEPGMR